MKGRKRDEEGRWIDGGESDGGREVGVSNGSSSPFVCSGCGPWSPFALVSAPLVLVAVLQAVVVQLGLKLLVNICKHALK